jgi:hypothetical protein
MFCATSETALGLSQPPIKRIWGDSLAGAKKRTGSEASSAEDKIG